MCFVVEKTGDADRMSETETMKTKYEQTARERDEAQRAYTLARQEVEALLHSLQEMKMERDKAIANYHSVVAAPSSVASTTGVLG